MSTDDPIPPIIDTATLPFSIQYANSVYWFGVFMPTIGLYLEGFGVNHAFVGSGVFLAVLAAYYNVAIRRVLEISAIARQMALTTSTEANKADQSIFQARTLMPQALAKGDLDLLMKLSETVKSCEQLSSNLKLEEQNTNDELERISEAEKELVDIERVFAVSGILIAGFGSYLYIPQL